MLNPNSECLCKYMLIHPVFHVGSYSWLNTFETKPCHFERSNSLSNASKSRSNFQIDPNVNVYHLSKAYPLSISAVDIPENHHFSKETHINHHKSSNSSKAKPFFLAAGRSITRTSTAACTAWATTSTLWPWSRRLGRWWMDSTWAGN